MSNRDEREWWPRLKAREIVNRLKISKPSDLSIEDIAWNQGALVIEGGLGGCDARLVHTPGISPAILRVRKHLSPPGKRRFAIAHELGHLKLAHNPGQPAECSEKEFLAWYNDQSDKEGEANVFAAELIMPESLFAPRLTGTTPGFEIIESLASDFQTTLTATAIRYVQLCGQKCAIVCSRNSSVAWSWPGPEFHYWIKRGRELRAHSYAIDFFCKGPDASEMREMQDVPRDAWIDGATMQDSITEQSRPLYSYGSVITLLWIRD
jgi:hypothetical protein